MSDRALQPGTADRRLRLFRRMVLAAVLLTLALLMLGAYVRLTDAGLGCPDWPGCYGKLSPAHASEQIDRAVQAQGGEHGPISISKAWREMIHRYIASALGLLIIVIAALAWRWRSALAQSPWFATALVGVVIMQGLFGKWTVTLLLKPAIVTGHLLGGLLTFVLLVRLWQSVSTHPRPVDAEPAAAMLWPIRIGLVLLVAQVFLGGWTSTNYAALACTDLPACQGQWWPPTDFANAFHLFRELGMTASGEALSVPALSAIHLAHRVGALVLTGALLWLGAKAWRTPGLQGLGCALMIAIIVQFCLGLSNVWFSLPIGIAIAHNGGAAVLAGLLTVLDYRAKRAADRI